MTPIGAVKGESHSLASLQTGADVARALHVSEGEINHILSRLSNHYRPRKRKKSDGTFRTLNVPNKALKLLQRKIVDHLLVKVPLPKCVHGGVPGKSVKRMALLHVGQQAVFKMDLDSFFPSVRPWAVRLMFLNLGIGENAAGVLTTLTTFNNELPQGAPTSTAVANIILGKIDRRLEKLCDKHGFRYTRWVDDLVFSGSMRLLDFRKLFRRVIEEEGFRAKTEKTKTMLRDSRQEIVGLVVNVKVNLPREKRESIRQEVLTALQSEKEVQSDVVGKAYWFKSVNAVRGEALVSKLKDGSGSSACR